MLGEGKERINCLTTNMFINPRTLKGAALRKGETGVLGTKHNRWQQEAKDSSEWIDTQHRRWKSAFRRFLAGFKAWCNNCVAVG